jgi:hypothetical protein
MTQSFDIIIASNGRNIEAIAPEHNYDAMASMSQSFDLIAASNQKDFEAIASEFSGVVSARI